MAQRLIIGSGIRSLTDRMMVALTRAGYDIHLLTSSTESHSGQHNAAGCTTFRSPDFAYRLARLAGRENSAKDWRMRLFGKSAAHWLNRNFADGSHPEAAIFWSSFAFESFRTEIAQKKILVRDSAHIATRANILAAELEKFGMPRESRAPLSPLRQERESAEYGLADCVVVPSNYARETFLDLGFASEKVVCIPPGVDLSLFAPSARSQRVSENSSEPLRVVSLGTHSLQLGTTYLLEATKNFPKSALELYLIGNASSELRPLIPKFPHAHWRTKMPLATLAEVLRSADVFVLPAIIDGYGESHLQSLAKMLAAGLLPIVTETSGVAEWVDDGENGFVVPAGDSLALRERLRFLLENRDRLRLMKEKAIGDPNRLGWQRSENLLTNWLAQFLAPQQNPRLKVAVSG